MNLNSILSWIGKFFGKLNVNGFLEDASLLSAAIATFHLTPFDMTTAPTWIAMGILGKSVLSILSNLNIPNAYVVLFSKIVGKLNDKGTAEDAALFAAATKAMLLIPVDTHNPVWLTAAGLAAKAFFGLVQQLEKPQA